MKEQNKDVRSCLCHIAGITELDERFGEPFIKAFGISSSLSNEELLAASYICSLFLSAIFNKFPTEKLNTFVHFVKEHYTRFSFNCNMYETIYNQMEKAELESVPLLDSQGHCTPRRCSKEDIFEAFDFYTNR